MTYEHMIEASDSSTVLSERVVMSGPFAGVAGRLMGNRLEQTFAASTGRIARLAEARLHSGG
jgi:hypothetical protein